MRALQKAICLTTLLILPSLVTAGEKVGEFDLSANVALTTDYVWRGVSQSKSDPALQGGFDVSHSSGLYVGVWGSNVDFNDTAQMELDIYAGFAKEFESGVSVDVGILHYDYPGAADGLDYAFNEYYLGVGYTIKGVGLNAKYSFSPDFYGTPAGNVDDKSAWYLDFGADYTLPYEVVIAAHYGYTAGEHFDNTANNPDSYADYKVSLSKEIKGFGFDLSYTDTNDDGESLNGKLGGERVFFTLSKSF